VAFKCRLSVGDSVGLNVGESVGLNVGGVGDNVGLNVGDKVGPAAITHKNASVCCPCSHTCVRVCL